MKNSLYFEVKKSDVTYHIYNKKYEFRSQTSEIQCSFEFVRERVFEEVKCRISVELIGLKEVKQVAFFLCAVWLCRAMQWFHITPAISICWFRCRFFLCLPLIKPLKAAKASASQSLAWSSFLSLRYWYMNIAVWILSMPAFWGKCHLLQKELIRETKRGNFYSR
mgnify:CR=1 FL=1